MVFPIRYCFLPITLVSCVYFIGSARQDVFSDGQLLSILSHCFPSLVRLSTCYWKISTFKIT